MAFGKRQILQGPDYTQHKPTLDDDGKLRVNSKAEWDGPSGDFLREIGASPDDPCNIIERPEDAQKRLDESRAEALKFAQSASAQLSVTLEPWPLIPLVCWQREHGDYLLRNLELMPFAPWNTILLPFDQIASLTLGISQVHPGHNPAIFEGLAELAEQFIGGSRAQFHSVFEETHRQLQVGNKDGLTKFAEARKTAQCETLAFARLFGIQTVGDDAYWRSRELFFKEPRPAGMPALDKEPILAGLMAHLNGGSRGG